MSYLNCLPNELKEILLYYFYLVDVIYYIDNLEEFLYLNSKDKEHFWKDIYHTFYTSKSLSYQNILRTISNITPNNGDSLRDAIKYIFYDFDVIFRSREYIDSIYM